MQFTRPRPIAWFFFLFAFGLTATAGTWQVERLKWKQGLIAELAEAQAQPPRNGLPKDNAELEALQFYPVTVRGTWLSDTEFHIAPRYVHDQFGYALVQPFKLTDGRIVLVNRGWIPGRLKNPLARPETKVKGSATINGIVRVGNERARFTPINQPEKNMWFGRDIEEMAAYAGLKNVVPAMIDIVEKPAQASKILSRDHAIPIPSDGVVRLRNDHLGYIFTWYGVALGVLIIFVLYHRKRA